MTDSNSIEIQRHNRYSPVLLHEHTFFELVYVYDGKCEHTLSGKPLSMHTGDMLIIPPGVKHSIAVFDDSIVFNIMIRKDTMHTIFYRFLNSHNILSAFFLNSLYARKASEYILFHTGSDAEIKSAFVWMYWEKVNKDRYYYECISATLSLCFFLIVRNYADSAQTPAFDDKFDMQRYEIVRFIQENYRDITLPAVAEHFHYTPEYVSRVVKESTGLTYSEILYQFRMDRAEELLLNTNLTVATIAEEIGYETSEHFNRQFKKYSGVAPTAFRKAHTAV